MNVRNSPDRGTRIAIWLHIANSGGWWRANEVDQALPGVPVSGRSTLSLLRDMADAQVVVRRVRGPNHVEFAVTSACRVQAGVTLAELARVHLIEQAA